MNATRAALLVLALVAIVGAIVVWNDEDESSERRAATTAARVAVHSAIRTGSPPSPAAGAAADVAAATGDDAAKLAQLPAAERNMLRAGLRPEEVFAMKQGFPDWETKFAAASDDMIRSHVSRVKDFLPTTIPGEVVHPHGIGTLDDFAHAAPGGGALDDVGRAAGGSIDDVARGVGRFGDDLLRLIGVGIAGAGAAGAAALRNRKKE